MRIGNKKIQLAEQLLNLQNVINESTYCGSAYILYTDAECEEHC